MDDIKKDHGGKFKMSRIPKKGTTIPKLHKNLDIQTSKRHMNRPRKVVNYITKNQKNNNNNNNGGKDKALSTKTSNPSKRRASPSLRSEVAQNVFTLKIFFSNFF